MNKLITILLSILLIFTGFNFPIFADENEIDESNDPDITEISDDNKIDEIETNLKDINIKLNNVEKSVNNIQNLSPGVLGIYTNYDFLTEYQLNYFVENINQLALFRVYDLNAQVIQVVYLNDLVSTQTTTYYYRFTYSKEYRILRNNTITEINYSNDSLGSVNFYFNNISDDNYNAGFYLARDLNNTYYSLTPYTINVMNNGLNDYTITPDSKYNLGYYPSGQTITISYDDSINDFFGFFDINGNLLSSNTSYTFDINENTNIVINYRAKEGIDYYPYLIYIILLLTLLFFTQIEKGVLNG